MTFSYVSLFSGIGGFEHALKKLGGACVMASEIDKFANQAYEALYGKPTVGDITKVDAKDIPDHDVLVGGFPCQAFSVAGKRGGFDDARGTLFFEMARIAAEKQPKLILAENVKGLVSHDKGKTLDTIVKTLNDIGYRVDFEILNSKYFGVPQNRERIFIVGIREDLVENEPWGENGVIAGTTVIPKGKRRLVEYPDLKSFNFDWPLQGEVTTRLRDILEPAVDERYYLSDEKTAQLVAKLDETERSKTPKCVHNIYGGFKETKPRVFEDESPTIRTSAGGGHLPSVLEEVNGLPIREATTKGYAVATEGDAVNIQFPNSKTRRGRVGRQVAQTLEASGVNQGVVTQGGEVDAGKKEIYTIEILRKLRKEVGEEAIVEWRLRVLDSLQQPEVLRQEMHGRLVQRQRVNEGPELVHSSQKSEGDKEPEGMRSLRINCESGRTSQGRGLEEQFSRELAVIMSELSHTNPSEEVLHNLRESAQGSRVLQQALSEIQEVWKSPLHEVPRYRIRKLTPLETFRLQGFPDSTHQTIVNAGISDSQRYKQAGNAVTVPVVEAIGARLLTYL